MRDLEERDHIHENCQHYLGTLSDYVDGTLSEDLCRELEAHMDTCENCRVVVNTFAKTISLYHRLPAPDVPDEVKERLFKVLDLKPFVSGDDSPAESTTG
jgi:anti-sigma factor RsiW